MLGRSGTGLDGAAFRILGPGIPAERASSFFTSKLQGFFVSTCQTSGISFQPKRHALLVGFLVVCLCWKCGQQGQAAGTSIDGDTSPLSLQPLVDQGQLPIQRVSLG